ncbi:MAG: GtrA family protein [Oscillospiraceae bacterium]|nr:GtrA family protein [Oscillospiraceae bacterium]
MDKSKYIKLFWEFFRYAVVGGIAFLIDSGTLFLFREFILNGGTPVELFISTAMGFIAGLIANYILSLVFVFRKSENKSSGKSVKGFIIFTVIGIIGLGLTELGMYTGVYLLKLHYLITKIVVAGLVLIWNYCGRKIFVFGKSERKDSQ